MFSALRRDTDLKDLSLTQISTVIRLFCPPDLWDAVMMSSCSAPVHMPSYGLATRTLPPPHLAIKQLVLRASLPALQFGLSSTSSRRSSVDSPLLLPQTKLKPQTGPGEMLLALRRDRNYNTPMAAQPRNAPAARRPLALIPGDDFDDDEDSSACSVDGDAEGGLAGGPECSHCHAHKTWSTDPSATQPASRDSLFPSFPPFARHVPPRPPRPAPL
ncbi:hypothetical protein B0H14DRAFT_3434930 [Mycena olivaceomarginata]|nr:hypothetical protein B0H14DRAFT_3434930 [Mycena olivaceomarginata]